jgi:hypothetical protein
MYSIDGRKSQTVQLGESRSALHARRRLQHGEQHSAFHAEGLREEQRLKVFENGALRRTYEPKRDEIIGHKSKVVHVLNYLSTMPRRHIYMKWRYISNILHLSTGWR